MVLQPANLFVKPDKNHKLTLKVGDFGLSCLDTSVVTPSQEGERFLKESRVSISDFPTLEGHSIGVGTSSYAAPEQLNSHSYGPSVSTFLSFEKFIYRNVKRSFC